MASAIVVTFEQIRERAYQLWEWSHRPEGLDIQFWLLAERKLKAAANRSTAEQGSHAGSSGDATD